MSDYSTLPKDVQRELMSHDRFLKKRAGKLSDEAANAYNLKANILMEHKLYDEALIASNKAVENSSADNSDVIMYLSTRAYLYALTGQIQAAVDDMKLMCDLGYVVENDLQNSAVKIMRNKTIALLKSQVGNL
jgi:tetratricopeptide (TPR) repeat protein